MNMESSQSESEDRKRLLAVASKALGIRINRVLQIQSDPVKYVLVIAGKEVEVGTADKFQSQRHIRSVIMNAIHEVPLPVPAKDWLDILRAMVQAAEVQAAPVKKRTIRGFPGRLRMVNGRVVLLKDRVENGHGRSGNP